MDYQAKEDVDFKMHDMLRGNKKILTIRERDILMKRIEQKCMQTQTSSTESGLASALVVPTTN